MTKQDLINNGYSDVIVFDNEDYDGCIVRITKNRRAVYSLGAMVVWYYEKYNCSVEEALEWIEYNTIRALPYGPKLGPIIICDI